MYLPTQVTYTTVVKVPMLPLKITCGFHLLTEFELGTQIRCPSRFLCLSPGDDGDLNCLSGHWTFSRSCPWAKCFVHVSRIPQHFPQGRYLYPLFTNGTIRVLKVSVTSLRSHSKYTRSPYFLFIVTLLLAPLALLPSVPVSLLSDTLVNVLPVLSEWHLYLGLSG